MYTIFTYLSYWRSSGVLKFSMLDNPFNMTQTKKLYITYLLELHKSFKKYRVQFLPISHIERVMEFWNCSWLMTENVVLFKKISNLEQKIRKFCNFSNILAEQISKFYQFWNIFSTYFFNFSEIFFQIWNRRKIYCCLKIFNLETKKLIFFNFFQYFLTFLGIL